MRGVTEVWTQDASGEWNKMTAEEVEQSRIEGEQELQAKIAKKGHDCSDHPKPYEFWEGDCRYHGWECSLCGDLIHTG